MENPQSNVAFRGEDGREFRASLSRLTRHLVVFELANPLEGLRVAAVLSDFSVNAGGRVVYAGRAVIRSQINSGSSLTCEATLSDEGWKDVDFAAIKSGGGWGAEYRAFLGEWQKLYRIRPEYKLVIADMQTYFTDLRLWLGQLESGLAGVAAANRATLEKEIAGEVAESVIPSMNSLFEQFEAVASQIDGEAAAAHQNYMRRALHPLMLCAPFVSRTFSKPLGYAGDYEVVNMIMRNSPEGQSLFAKVLHTWFVRQPPAVAHRNRISYLVERIAGETLRVSGTGAGREAKIYNAACGPAAEVVKFRTENPLRNRAEFTLLDFNEETLDYAKSASGQTGLPPVQCVKRSVHNLLKEGSRRHATTEGAGQYDLVYCAGLFDYLTDQACQRLLDVMYEWVAPGGLLIATNVEPANPLRHGMEHLLDWPLVYRTAPQLKAVKPAKSCAEDLRIHSDETGVNVFLEVRRPGHE